MRLTFQVAYFSEMLRTPGNILSESYIRCSAIEEEVNPPGPLVSE
jgi:hypothetical protein